MKQKITIKVTMPCEKAKLKAMNVASKYCGVDSVSADREKGQLVVVGENIDIVSLLRSLNKKVCSASIETVVEEKKEEKKDEENDEKKVECCFPCPLPPCPYGYPNIPMCVVRESDPRCPIM